MNRTMLVFTLTACALTAIYPQDEPAPPPSGAPAGRGAAGGLQRGSGPVLTVSEDLEQSDTCWPDHEIRP